MNIAYTSWYTRNINLHRNLEVALVINEIGKFARNYENRFINYINIEAIKLILTVS